jgi:hypothetical protein
MQQKPLQQQMSFFIPHPSKNSPKSRRKNKESPAQLA